MITTKNIAEYYNSHFIEEDMRLSPYSMEYLMTKHLINVYATHSKTVCDLGGGTGIYALPLAQKGKDVTLVDISPKEIEFAKNKASKLGVKIAFICGDLFADDFDLEGTYDLVLCLGPLYHCRNLHDVDNTLNKVQSLLHHNSIAILAFLSKYSKFNDMVKHYGLITHNSIGSNNAATSYSKTSSININDICAFYEDMLCRKDLFSFYIKSGIPISFIEPTLIRTYLEQKEFIVREVVASDICDYIDMFFSSEDLSRFLEIIRRIGSGAKINGGNHILTIIQKMS